MNSIPTDVLLIIRDFLPYNDKQNFRVVNKMHSEAVKTRLTSLKKQKEAMEHYLCLFHEAMPSFFKQRYNFLKNGKYLFSLKYKEYTSIGFEYKNKKIIVNCKQSSNHTYIHLSYLFNSNDESNVFEKSIMEDFLHKQVYILFLVVYYLLNKNESILNLPLHVELFLYSPGPIDETRIVKIHKMVAFLRMGVEAVYNLLKEKVFLFKNKHTNGYTIDCRKTFFVDNDFCAIENTKKYLSLCTPIEEKIVCVANVLCKFSYTTTMDSTHFTIDYEKYNGDSAGIDVRYSTKHINKHYDWYKNLIDQLPTPTIVQVIVFLIEHAIVRIAAYDCTTTVVVNFYVDDENLHKTNFMLPYGRMELNYFLVEKNTRHKSFAQLYSALVQRVETIKEKILKRNPIVEL